METAAAEKKFYLLFWILMVVVQTMMIMMNNRSLVKMRRCNKPEHALTSSSPLHHHHHCILKLLRPISAFFSTHTSNNFRYLIAPYTIFCPVFLKPISFSPVILINSTRLSERHQSKNEKKT